MPRQHVQGLLALGLAGGRDVPAQPLLVAGVVGARMEPEARDAKRIARRHHGLRLPGGGGQQRRAEGPAGEDTRQRRDVSLRVAAVDAERVQLHQLACVVFVEAAAARTGRRTAGVVQVMQHRRMPRRRVQHVGEAAQRIRADRVLLVVAHEHAVEVLAPEDVEVVVPEGHHHFLELARAGQRTVDARLPGGRLLVAHELRVRTDLRRSGLPGWQVQLGATLGTGPLHRADLARQFQEMPQRLDGVLREELLFAQARLQGGRKSDGLRLQLRVDPCARVTCDLFQVARRRAIAQPVERVDRSRHARRRRHGRHRPSRGSQCCRGSMQKGASPHGTSARGVPPRHVHCGRGR